MRRFELPGFLDGRCAPEAYRRWLHRKAQAHVRRDRARFGRESCAVALYKTKIHDAVTAEEIVITTPDSHWIGA